MNERCFKVLAIMSVILGAVLLLSALKIGPQRAYGLYSVLGYALLIGSVVLCVAFYSKKYNMYDTYAYIPVFLVLSPILNIGHGNKYAVFLITLVEIAYIVAATHVIIDKKEKAICKAVCSKWKSSLSKIIFSMCALKFVEDTFDIATNIDTSVF